MSKENLNAAYLQVVRNKGAAGVDGMTVEELGPYLSENGENIREQLRTRKYKRQPVRRVEIPKPDGGIRNLGVPTVTSYCTPPNDVLECCLQLYGRQLVSGERKPMYKELLLIPDWYHRSILPRATRDAAF